MTIEQVKEEAKKRFDRDLTDEQARAWLEAHPAGELQDEELADVAGGGCGSSGEVNVNRLMPAGRPIECPACGYVDKEVELWIENKYQCRKCRQWFIGRPLKSECIEAP